MHATASKSRLPIARITGDDVIEYCAHRSQNPTKTEALAWLHEHKIEIQSEMREVIQDHLNEILDEVSCSGHPDPRVDKQHYALEELIDKASDKYARSIGKDHLGSSIDFVQMLQVARLLLDHPNRFKACFEFKLEFGDFSPKVGDHVVTHQTDRIHVTCEGGKLSVELVAAENCNHDRDVFVAHTAKLQSR